MGGDSWSFLTRAEPRGGWFFLKAEAAGAIIAQSQEVPGFRFLKPERVVRSLGAGAGAATCLEGSSRWQPGLVML